MQLFITYISLFLALASFSLAQPVYLKNTDADGYAHPWSVACNALVKEVNKDYGPKIQVVDSVHGHPNGHSHEADGSSILVPGLTRAVSCAYRYTGKTHLTDLTAEVRYRCPLALIARSSFAVSRTPTM